MKTGNISKMLDIQDWKAANGIIAYKIIKQNPRIFLGINYVWYNVRLLIFLIRESP